MVKNYVGYCRVSTKEQAREGHSLDGQEALIRDFVRREGGRLIDIHVEVMSGRDNERPGIARAMEQVKAFGATLITSRLDRLSRDVAFLAAFIATGADFVACDCPQADKTLLYFQSIMAQYEAEKISQRTCEGLKVARVKGITLGNPGIGSFASEAGRKGAMITNARKKVASRQRTETVVAMMKRAVIEHRCVACSTAMAEHLNAIGVPRPSGRPWDKRTVMRVCKQAGDTAPEAWIALK